MNLLDMADPLKSIAQKKVKLTAAAAAALDEFCAQVAAASNGENPDLQALSASMGGIGKWSAEIEKAKPAPPGEACDWQAEFFGLPGLGGSLTCGQGDRALLFSLDGEGQPYQGAFEDGRKVTSFKAAPAGGSTIFTLERDGEERSFTLPESAHIWGSLDAFLQTLPSKPMSAPPSTADVPGAAVAPEDNARCLKCGTTLKAGARFCGQCGEPVNSIPQATAVETRSCPNCGKKLPASARFCGECGRPVN